MSLMLHCGASALNRDQLAALPIPAAKGTRHVVRPFVEDVDLIERFFG